MSDLDSVTLENGKYTIVGIEEGNLRALRHGDEWRSLVGDKLVLTMAQEIRRLEAELEEAREQAREISAVMEKVRALPRYSVADPFKPWDAVDGEDIDHALLAVPQDLLREVKADVWDECLSELFLYHQSHGLRGRETNPYRESE